MMMNGKYTSAITKFIKNLLTLLSWTALLYTMKMVDWIKKPHGMWSYRIVKLKKLNNSIHYLISSVCISKNGSMIWNYTDKAKLTMKNFSDDALKNYLSKIPDETLYAYNVYQIEGEGRSLFASIEGDEDTIMGLPVKKIKEYISSL